MALTTLTIGRVKLIYRGAYNPETTYDALDWVSIDNGVAFCVVNNTLDVTPTNDSPNWEIITGSVANMTIDNFTAVATALPAGSAPTATYDANTGVLTIGIPTGGGAGGGSGGGFGYDLTSLNCGDSEKLAASISMGGEWTGNCETLTLALADARQTLIRSEQNSERQYLKHALLPTNTRCVLRNFILCGEGNCAIELEPAISAGAELVCENVTFINTRWYFGGAAKRRIVFRNCIFRDNQYNAIVIAGQNADVHIENCRFVDARPNYAEYRADLETRSLVGWAYDPIRLHYCTNTCLTLKGSTFKNIMPLRCISAGGETTDNSKLTLRIEHCLFEDTNGTAIHMGKRGWNGYVRACEFYKLGSLRCNAEGYEKLSDDGQPWTLRYGLGVGGNAVYTFPTVLPQRVAAAIENNRIIDGIENGIEGDYEIVRGNYIENMGYRRDEGIVNPSMECIYGDSLLIENNYCRNPQDGSPGIVLPKGLFEGAEPRRIRGNTVVNTRDTYVGNAGIYINVVNGEDTEAISSPLYVYDNNVSGFIGKYRILNVGDAAQQKTVITDSDLTFDGAKLMYSVNPREINGVTFDGAHMGCDMARNPRFADWTNGAPDEWRVAHCDAALYREDKAYFLRLTGNAISNCAAVAQYTEFPLIPGIVTVEVLARSSTGRIGMCVKCLYPDGSAPFIDNASDTTMSDNYRLLSCPDAEFGWVRTSYPAMSMGRVAILQPTSQIDETFTTLDIKEVRYRWRPNEAYPAGRYGEAAEALELDANGNPVRARGFDGTEDMNYSVNNGATVNLIKLSGTVMQKSLTSAVNIAMYGSGYTIQLIADTVISTPLWLIRGTFTIDLNGYKLSAADPEMYCVMKVWGSANITIIDSSEVKTGVIENTGKFALALGNAYKSGSSLNIRGGTILGGNRAVFVNLPSIDSRSPELNLYNCVLGKETVEGDPTYKALLVNGKQCEVHIDVQDPDHFVVMHGIQLIYGRLLISRNTCVHSAEIDDYINSEAAGVTIMSTDKHALTCEFVPDYMEDDLSVSMDDSTVVYEFINSSGETEVKTGTLTSALATLKQKTTADKRGWLCLTDDIFSYTGFNTNGGFFDFELNGYKIQAPYQNYALRVYSTNEIVIMDSSGGMGGMQSAGAALALTGGNTNVTINGGTYSAPIDGKSCVLVQSGATLTVNGGSFTGNSHGIQGNTNSKITVNGGHIVGNTGRGLMLLHITDAATVSGGTFIGGEAGVSVVGALTLQGIDGFTADIENGLRVNDGGSVVIGADTTVTRNMMAVTSVAATLTGRVYVSYGAPQPATDFLIDASAFDNMEVGISSSTPVRYTPLGAIVGTAITWTVSPASGLTATQTGDLLTLMPSAAGNFTLTGTLANSASHTWALDVSHRISILTEPTDVNTMAQVISQSLTCAAIATDDSTITYQWYHSADGTTATGSVVTNATDAVFPLPTSLTRGTYWYFCVATSATLGAATTRVAEVNVSAFIPEIRITHHPLDAVRKAGAITGSLMCAAAATDSSPVAYQWYVNSTINPFGGRPIPGAISNTMALDAAASEGIYYYYCVATSETAGSATSNVATVIITPPADPSLARYFLYYDFKDLTYTTALASDLSPNARNATLTGFDTGDAGYTADGLRSGATGVITVPITGLGSVYTIRMELEAVHARPSGGFNRVLQVGSTGHMPLSVIFRMYRTSALQQGYAVEDENGHSSLGALSKDDAQNKFLTNAYITSHAPIITLAVNGNAFTLTIDFGDGHVLTYSVPDNEHNTGWSSFSPTLAAETLMYLLNKPERTHGIDVTISKFWIREGTWDEEEETSYFTAAVAERAADITALQAANGGDTITFAHMTDVHMRMTDEKPFARLQEFVRLSEAIPLDYVVCTGDLLENAAPWDGVTKPELTAFADIMAGCSCPWYAIHGNHDYGDANLAGATATTELPQILVTPAAYHAIIGANTPSVTGITITRDPAYPLQNYYYVDDSIHSHRMIFLNSFEVCTDNTQPDGLQLQQNGSTLKRLNSLTVNQFTWLMNTAMDMTGKTGWTVSIFSHNVPYTDAVEFHNYGTSSGDLRALATAFRNGVAFSRRVSLTNPDTLLSVSLNMAKDFSAQGAIALTGWYAGHVHDDCYVHKDDVHYVVSTCTRATQRKTWTGDLTKLNLPPARNTGALAASINVFVVNKTMRVVNMIKIGAKADNTVKTSSDRYWTY